MKKLFFLFLAVITLLSNSACDDNAAKNFYFVPLEIVAVEVPEFFELEEIYQIRVTYNKPDACTQFTGFDVQSKATTLRDFAVIATSYDNLDDCAPTVIEESTTFNFKVIHNETYTFRFWQGKNSDGTSKYLEVEIPMRS